MSHAARSDDAVRPAPRVARVLAAFEAACPPDAPLPTFDLERPTCELTPVQQDIATAVGRTLGEKDRHELVRFVAEGDPGDRARDVRTTGFLIIAAEMLRAEPSAAAVEPLWARLVELFARPVQYVGEDHDRTVYLCPNAEQTVELLLDHAALPGVPERLESMLAGSLCEGVGEASTYSVKLGLRPFAIRRIARGRHARGELDADWLRDVMIRQPDQFDQNLVRSGFRQASDRRKARPDGDGTTTNGGAFLADYRRLTREAALGMVAELDRFAKPFLELFFWSTFEGTEWIDAALGFLGTGRSSVDDLLGEDADGDAATIVQGLLRAVIDPEADADALGAIFARHDPDLVRAALPFLDEARSAALAAIGEDKLAAFERFARETSGPEGGWWDDRIRDSIDPANGVLDLARARKAVDGLAPADIRNTLRHLNDGDHYDSGTGVLLSAVAGIGRERIESSLRQCRNDAIKAYGLLPLEGDDELAERHARFDALRARARRQDSYLRPHTLAAIEAGLTNLAHRAGLADTFALELRVLADGPHANVRLGDWRDAGNWQIALTLDAGRTRIVARRDQPLKSVPAALRTEAAFVALAETRDALAPVLSRLADALDDAMYRGRPLAASELDIVRRSPLLADLFGALVFVDESGTTGLLDIATAALVDLAGVSRPMNGVPRLAHVADGNGTAPLARWHERLHALGVVQPVVQTGRVAFRLHDGASDRTRLDAPDQRLLHGRRIESRLNGTGWRFDLSERTSRGKPTRENDGDWYEPNVARRRDPRGALTVALRFSPIIWKRSMEHEATRLQAIEFEFDGKPCALGEVDPVLLSDTVALVSALVDDLPLPASKAQADAGPWTLADVLRIEPPITTPPSTKTKTRATGGKAKDHVTGTVDAAELERARLARLAESLPAARASRGLAGLRWGLASLRDERLSAASLKDSWNDSGERVRVALAAGLEDGEEATALDTLIAGFDKKTLKLALPFVHGAREAVLRHLGWSDEAIRFDALVRRTASIELGRRPERPEPPLFEDIDFTGFDSLTLDAKSLGTCLNLWKKMASEAGSRSALYLIRATVGLDAERVERQIETMYPLAIAALGCLPVADRAELAERRTRLLGLRTEAKHYGRERSTTIREAIAHGLQLLARRNGYTDATRLGWALQADAAVHAFDAWEPAGDWEIALVPDGGDVRIAIRKEGKPRKSVPAALRKERAWKAMRTRQDLSRAEARDAVRTLQAMMCAGDRFSREELDTVRRVPLVSRLLAGLVLEDGGGRFGLPDDSLGALRDEHGDTRPVDGGLRIVHPLHLFERDALGAWQRRIVEARVVQPFRQVFRELYVPTPAELEAGSRSTRFAGRGIDAAKTAALLHGRGYQLGTAEDPYATRVFAREKVTAVVEFDGLGWHHFGEDNYGETPTIGEITFRPIDAMPCYHGEDDASLPFVEVPPLVFSETMRDLDLVASVALPTDDDGRSTSPEVVATRAQLLGALFADLALANVSVEDKFVRVVGERASYRVHLGSAVIHVEPGNYLCIVPAGGKRPDVHLPFAEADRRFDEIVAKVLLLADDAAITDPTILAQIRPPRPAA